MATRRIEEISIENLNLDHNNPRFPDQGTQRLAIETLAKQQGSKLFKLAEDIAKNNGLDPSQLPLVEENEETGIYTVLEGNRRIAALKLLHSIPLLESLDLSRRFKERMKHLHDTYADTLPTVVQCSVMTREAAQRWIFLRHTGSNDGVGVVSWDGLATQRFRGNSPALQAVDLVATSGLLDDDTLGKLARFPISTLKRIFDTAEARGILGVEVTDSGFTPIDNSDDVLRRLAIIISDLAHRRIKVKALYTVDHTVKYVSHVVLQAQESIDDGELDAENVVSLPTSDTFISFDSETEAAFDEDGILDQNPDDSLIDANEPDIVIPLPSSGNLVSPDPVQTPLPVTPPVIQSPPTLLTGTQSIPPVAVPATVTRTRRVSPYRRTLMPTSFKVRIHENRLNKVYHELLELDIEDFPNSVAVMFRVFVELSVDEYGRRNGIALTKTLSGTSTTQQPKDMNFGEKVREVAKVLFDSGKINKGDYTQIVSWSGEQKVKKSIDFLHEYLHNPSASPSPSDLKAHWESIQPFVQQLFD